MTERYDVVVVGSGAGGGVAASRLSEDESRTVLLLEAGPDYQVAGFFDGGACGMGGGSPPTPELDWAFVSEPLPGGHRIPLPRGKLVGGTTMTNGCVWVRGRPSDFDRWVAAGAEGWGFDDIVRFYERVDGEVPSMAYARPYWLPAQETLAEACLGLGYRFLDDLNAPDAWDGVVGPLPRNRRNEIRQGSLVTYIARARDRPNFTVRGRSLVDRVLVRGGRAAGVVYGDEGGREHTVEAGHVVLSAGTFGSAPILLRSGIGPAAALRSLGIEPVVDLPVGQHVLDHPMPSFIVRSNSSHARTGWPTFAMGARDTPWLVLAEPIDEQEGLTLLLFMLATLDTPRGTVELRSSDPTSAPVIDLNYAQAFAAGVFEPPWEAFQTLLETAAYRAVGAVDVLAGVGLAEHLDGRIGGGTHAVGGCSIGAVVDPDLAVYGIDGLTVADASVFPSHVSNNPNLTCFAIGEVAAEGVAARQGRSP
jgi:choline dehydrogenase